MRIDKISSQWANLQYQSQDVGRYLVWLDLRVMGYADYCWTTELAPYPDAPEIWQALVHQGIDIAFRLGSFNYNPVLVGFPGFLPDAFDLHDILGCFKRTDILTILNDSPGIFFPHPLQCDQLLDCRRVDVDFFLFPSQTCPHKKMTKPINTTTYLVFMKYVILTSFGRVLWLTPCVAWQPRYPDNAGT